MGPAIEISTKVNKRTPWQLFAMSVMWLGLNAISGSLVALLAPLQIEDVLQRNGVASTLMIAEKSTALAWILTIGSIIAMMVPLLTGWASDYTHSRWGRRRPYVFGGIVVSVVGLGGMMTPPNLIVYGCYYMLLSVGTSIVISGTSGFIPDLVAPDQRGVAAGWMVGLTVIGTMVGLVIVQGVLQTGVGGLDPASEQAVYGLLITLLVGCGCIVGVGVRERTDSDLQWLGLRSILHALRSPNYSADFTWVLLTRFMMTFGFGLSGGFLVYFLQDAAGLPTSAIPGAITLLYAGLLSTSLVGGVVGGRISDRIGRKPLVYGAGGMMTIGVIGFAFTPGTTLPGPGPAAFNPIFWFGLILGFGYGAYQAVDWALATDVLPNGQHVGRDLAVWNVALVLPQALSSAVDGLLLAGMAELGWSAQLRYGLIFAVSGLFFAVATLGVRRIRTIR